MSRKFIREQHNRQDKSFAPDGVPDLYLTNRTLFDERSSREKLLKGIKKATYCKRDRVFKMGWSIEHFAKINSLASADSETRRTFLEIRDCARHDSRVLRDAVFRRTLRCTEEDCEIVYTFTSCHEQLLCDEIRFRT